VSPEVSVVVAARNEGVRIGRAIESILGQTLADWELVVVDDGSTDATADVVRSYADPRIRLVALPPGGLARALNRGIEAAAAELVARQDADDESLPGRLERQVAFLRERPDVAVVGSGWEEIGPHGEPVRPRVALVTGRVNEVLPRFNPLTHTSVTFRKSAVLAAGGYDEGLQFAQDYDLWLRLAHSGETLWNLDDVLVVRAMTGENVSSRRERAQILAELRIRRRDLARRRRAGLPTGDHRRALLARTGTLLAPAFLKRAVRRRRGQAP
jgi:glycosyltransferase involved in cell wall biosynthesis